MCAIALPPTELPPSQSVKRVMNMSPGRGCSPYRNQGDQLDGEDQLGELTRGAPTYVDGPAVVGVDGSKSGLDAVRCGSMGRARGCARAVPLLVATSVTRVYFSCRGVVI